MNVKKPNSRLSRAPVSVGSFFALGLLSGCQLLALPFQLLGALVDQALELAPKALPLLMMLAQVPADAPPGLDSTVPEIPGYEIPAEGLGGQSATDLLAYITTNPNPFDDDFAEVLSRLVESTSLHPDPTGSAPCRIVVWNPNLDPRKELSRILENTEGGRWKSFVVRARIRPEESAKRQRLLGELEKLGAEIVVLPRG